MIPQLPLQKSETSREVLAAQLNEWSRSVALALSHQPELAPFSVRITTPDVDVFVPHSLGRKTVEVLLGPVEPYASEGALTSGHVTVSKGSKAPTKDGLYLRAHFEAPISFVIVAGLACFRK